MIAPSSLWPRGKPSYHGRFVSFKNIQAYPRPLQQPSPPIIIGGFSTPALRRTLKYAHGWFGWGLNLEKTQQCIARFHLLEQKVERPTRLGVLEISVHLSIPVTPAVVEQLAGLGVHRIVLSLPMPADKKTALEFINHTSKELLPQS